MDEPEEGSGGEEMLIISPLDSAFLFPSSSSVMTVSSITPSVSSTTDMVDGLLMPYTTSDIGVFSSSSGGIDMFTSSVMMDTLSLTGKLIQLRKMRECYNYSVSGYMSSFRSYI